MKTYYASGTVGDTYVILCKLYAVAKEEKIICKHYTRNKSAESIIREVYSLMPNIEVEFMKYMYSDVRIRGAFCYDGKEKEQAEYNLKPEYYPEFSLGAVERFNLPATYRVLQIKAGIGQNRRLDAGIVKMILNNPKFPIVLIGETNMNLPEIPEERDLRDKTSVKEAINIIKNSKHFYGPQGFLSFVAVSHRILSDVYIKSQIDATGIKNRIEAVEEWRRFLIRK